MFFTGMDDYDDDDGDYNIHDPFQLNCIHQRRILLPTDDDDDGIFIFLSWTKKKFFFEKFLLDNANFFSVTFHLCFFFFDNPTIFSKIQSNPIPIIFHCRIFVHLRIKKENFAVHFFSTYFFSFHRIIWLFIHSFDIHYIHCI